METKIHWRDSSISAEQILSVGLRDSHHRASLQQGVCIHFDEKSDGVLTFRF